MSARLPQVPLVEDSSSLAMMYQQYLRNEKLHLSLARTGEQAKTIIRENLPDLVLLDLGLPDVSGQSILEWIHAEALPCHVIVITADNTVDTVVEVMRLGAVDFLEKPFDAARLITTVNNALKQSNLEAYVDNLKNTFDRQRYHGFVGSSLSMQAVYRIIDSVAASKATVFITGESGTGKEVCADAIHKQSPRANKAFIAINCAAIPRELMESEIFGHTKGAFTGANNDRKGAASQADGGTLFLDEIAEMDMDLQSKLLRFIQTGGFKKVGGNIEESVDIRIICATNKDPLAEVKAGRFREDLYYRLHVIPIDLPPLRERESDILEIARYFLHKFARAENKRFTDFDNETSAILCDYAWPGNVRQLQNTIMNIAVLHDDELVHKDHLPAPLNRLQATSGRAETSSIAAPAATIASIRPLALVEREAIEQAIALCDGNIPRAAALLEVSPSTIYRKKTTWN